MEHAEVCRQLEELQGFRANAAAGERPGEDTPLGVTAEAASGGTRVGETAHTQDNEFLHNVEALLQAADNISGSIVTIWGLGQVEAWTEE